MIDYSLSYQTNPMDADATKKYYAKPQVSEVIDLQKFSQHIASHGCVYSRADIQCVLLLSLDCIRELLLQGRKVELGELGSFQVSLKSKGKLNAADFDASTCIKIVKGRFSPGKLLKDLKADAEFQQVASRAVQQATIKKLNGSNTGVTTGTGTNKKTVTVSITKS